MNEERIPNEVFDWLMTKDFNSLTEEQKAVVCEFISENEYRTMRIASGLVSNEMKSEEISMPDHDEVLGKVLAKNAKSRRGIAGFFMRPIPLWKAAACVVFLLAIIQWPKFRTNAESSGIVSLADTIFVTVRDTITLVERDTVWKENKPNRVQYAANARESVSISPSRSEERSIVTNTSQLDLHVFQPEDINTHRISGRSAANDRAVREIGFVGM
jgi:hypothetical protein